MLAVTHSSRAVVLIQSVIFASSLSLGILTYVSHAHSADQIPGSPEVFAALTERGVVRIIAQVGPPDGEIAPSAVEAAKADLQTLMIKEGAIYVHPLQDLPLVVLELNSDQLEALLKSGLVNAIELDRVFAPQLAESAPLIRAPEIWQKEARGGGQYVVVIDTGVDDTHEFLKANTDTSGAACFSAKSVIEGATSLCPNGEERQEGTLSARPCEDLCNHGTHVAGIVAGNNATMSGVAPAAAIIPIQVFSKLSSKEVCKVNPPCVRVFDSSVREALQYVRNKLAPKFKIAAVNLSLGGGEYPGHCDNDRLKPFVDALTGLNISVVAASGNEGKKNAIVWPACISGVVSVGNTSKLDMVAGRSNSASILSVLAPGTSINSSIPSGEYDYFNGTSMAAPHVAGAIAALRSIVPPSVSNAMIVDALVRTGKPIRDINEISKPRIDVAAALQNLTMFSVAPFQPWEGYSIASGHWQLGDYSGDGKTDLLHLASGDDYANVWTSNGDGTFALNKFVPWQGYDVGNGAWLSGDFAGDKKDDVIHLGAGSNSANVWISGGGGNFGLKAFKPWDGYAMGSGRWLVGDFGGDERKDLVHLISGSDYANIWIAQGDGSFAISQIRPWAGYAMSNGHWLAADVTGDGLADLIHRVFGGDYVYVWIASKSGAFGVKQFTPWAGYDVVNGRWLSGDYNGDGKFDLVHLGAGGDTANIWRSKGDGTFDLAEYRPWSGYDVTNGTFLAGNFNDDGLTDLIHLVAGSDYANIWYAKPNGGFDIALFRPRPGYSMGTFDFEPAPSPPGRWLSGDFGGQQHTDLVNLVDGTSRVEVWIDR